MTESDVEKVENLAIKLYSENNQFRKGQSFFNALYILYPDEANRIRGTEFDPFYDTSRIKKCKETLLKNT